MHDTLNGGRRFRNLNVVDCFSREALAVEVDTGLSGHRVVRVLQRLLETRGKPTQNGVIESFNGKMRDECLNEASKIAIEIEEKVNSNRTDREKGSFMWIYSQHRIKRRCE